MNRYLVFLSLALFTVAGCVTPWTGEPLNVVGEVDLDRYAGKWYEIARYPNWFERDCTGATAEYELLANGRIRVTNRCYGDETPGAEDTIVGTARIPDAAAPAKLKVSFFGPFEADYWIIELDEDYQWAVVGEPSRGFLWILSRAPELDADTLDDLLARISLAGYDPDQLIFNTPPIE